MYFNYTSRVEVIDNITMGKMAIEEISAASDGQFMGPNNSSCRLVLRILHRSSSDKARLSNAGIR